MLTVIVSFLLWTHIGAQYAGVEGERVHFYGNDGVCVFKYLVTMDDPQKWFSLSLLFINFICFLLISWCYIHIYIANKVSAQNVGNAGNQPQRNWKLEMKIRIIIATDFLCWVPLLIVCLLHFAGVVDASPWYPLFSIIVLPINSVINPLLYDNTILSVLGVPCLRIYRTILHIKNGLREFITMSRNMNMASSPEQVAMDHTEAGNTPELYNDSATNSSTRVRDNQGTPQLPAINDSSPASPGSEVESEGIRLVEMRNAANPTPPLQEEPIQMTLV